MKTTYFKKTKMVEIAKKIFTDIPKLKDFTYKFYRGTEWLTWYSDEECEDGYISWKITRDGYAIRLEKEHHLESEFKCVVLEQRFFRFDKDYEELKEEIW